MYIKPDPDAHVAEVGDGFYRLRRAADAEYRASKVQRLRDEARALSDELEQVNRELNAMGANDG